MAWAFNPFTGSFDITGDGVPYTGATGDVDLGVHKLLADEVYLQNDGIQAIHAVNVVGHSGLGTMNGGIGGSYQFAIVDNTANTYMQIMTSTFNVEGPAFFGGEGNVFVMYATEGGGIHMIPDTGESLVAVSIGQHGYVQITNDTSANAESLQLNQNMATYGFLDFEGTTAADQTKSISTVLGPGIVTGPKTKTVSAGWTFVGMIKQKVNGGDAWIPYYTANP